MTRAPSYRWRCHACDACNEPHTAHCVACGFPAVATADQIDTCIAQPRNNRPVLSGLAAHLGLFFPEGIVGALLVLATPFWAIYLGLAGRWAAALVLISGMGLAVFAFVQLMRRGYICLAYFVTIGALALAWVVDASS